MLQITHIAGNGAGEASHLAVQGLSSSEVLTAMKNGSDNLELIGFYLKDGVLSRGATATAGTVGEVALAILGRTAVTAVRSGSNRLLLISWAVSSQVQAITRLHDSANAAGEASCIAITPISQNMFITAMRDGGGDLLLICWSLQPDGSFRRLGESNPPGRPKQAGAVSLVAATSVGNNLVVTAVKNGSNQLELIAWQVSADGSTITRKDPAGTNAGVIGDSIFGDQRGELAITAYRDPMNEAPGVITAMQNASGNLQLIAWRIIDQGVGFQMVADTNTMQPASDRPGTASHISVSPSGYAEGNFLASMRRGSGDLELIDFSLSSSGWKRECSYGERQGTDVTETAIVSFFGRAVTATRKANYLNVFLWQIETASQPHAVDTSRINQWFTTVLSDSAQAKNLKADWKTLFEKALPLTPGQKASITSIPEADAKELNSAVAMVVDHGGTIHLQRQSESSPGTLIIQPLENGNRTAELSVGVFHCKFDANCRNWHCKWGPARS